MADDIISTPTTTSILVAETDNTARASLSELLREEGYVVVEAADSGTAIAQVRRNLDLNIILADLEMPAWTTVVRHTHNQAPKSFILGMLRYGALSNALEAERLGAHGYFVKPLVFGEVNEWIQRCLTGQIRIKS
jgi:DNA-binding NtrC family response regulator